MDGSCRGYQLIPLQLNPAVSGNMYGQFSSSGTFVPWDQNNSYCMKSQFTGRSIPDTGAMLCYPVHIFQDDYNSARPLWSFSNDMDHQGFYGTCYLKPRPVVFGPQAPVANDVDNNYRFHDKCLPCDNVGMDKTTPRWGPNNKKWCDDCAARPVPPKTLPSVATWNLVASNQTFMDPAHWLSPAGSPWATMEECKMLAQRDTTCSKWVMFSPQRTARIATTPAMNVNNTASVALFATNNGVWRYTAFSLTFSYYRTCACLNKDPANAAVGYMPAVDTTQFNMACAGVMTNASCAVRGFNIYKLA
jgi:hypothetical protein